MTRIIYFEDAMVRVLELAKAQQAQQAAIEHPAILRYNLDCLHVVEDHIVNELGKD